MSEVKHTPGPWSVSPPGEVTHSSDISADHWFALARVVTVFDDDPDSKHSAQGRANARLIAAAPELLEALETVRDSAAWFDLQASEQAVVSAAIAKATGGEA